MDRTLAAGYQNQKHTISDCQLFSYINNMSNSNLHERREKVPVCKIGDQASFVCSTSHGNGRLDSFEPHIDWKN